MNYGTLWASGHAAATHQNPYAAYPESHRVDFSRYGGPVDSPDLNLNPPFTLPVLQLLSHLTIYTFVKVWVAGMWFCLSAAITLIYRKEPSIQGRRIVWLSVSTLPLFALSSGQVYAPLFLLSTLSLHFYKDNRNLAAAIAIGLLVAMRPTMIFWPVCLYFAGHRRVAFIATGTILVLYALPLPFYGTAIYHQWLAAAQHDIHWMDISNISLLAVARRLGAQWPGILIATMLAIAAIVWVRRYRPGFVPVSGIALCLGILVVPIGWSFYTLFLAPYFAARRWGWVATISGAAFFLPSEVLVKTSGIPLLLAVLLMLGIFMAQARSRI